MGTGTMGSGATMIRRSLVDSTADLFTAEELQSLNAADLPNEQRGQSMAQNLPAGMSIVKRSGDGSQLQHDDRSPEPSVLNDPRALEVLVDKVVERLERRVVDELERRGRRYNPGAF
jgi:hypothetical protein